MLMLIVMPVASSCRSLRGKPAQQPPKWSAPHSGTKAVASRLSIGKTLQWRKVADLSLPSVMYGYGVMLAGNFEAGGDQELLVLYNSGSRLFRLDGSSTSTAIAINANYLYDDRVSVWDYDRDGVDELVYSGIYGGLFNSSDCLHIFALPGGQELASLDEEHAGFAADLDGDGSKEFCVNSPDGSCHVYGQDGELQDKAAVEIALGAGDFDGDGAAELISYDNPDTDGHNAVLHLTPWRGQTTSYRGDGAWYPGLFFDLSGDGVCDVICEGWGYIEGKSKRWLNFEQLPPYDEASIRDACYACWRPFDKGSGVYVEVLQTNSGGEFVRMWDAGGKLFHEESFSSPIHSVCVVHVAGQQELAVLLADSILLSQHPVKP